MDDLTREELIYLMLLLEEEMQAETHVAELGSYGYSKLRSAAKKITRKVER